MSSTAHRRPPSREPELSVSTSGPHEELKAVLVPNRFHVGLLETLGGQVRWAVGFVGSAWYVRSLNRWVRWVVLSHPGAPREPEVVPCSIRRRRMVRGSPGLVGASVGNVLIFQAPRECRRLSPIPHEEDLWLGGPRDSRARQWIR